MKNAYQKALSAIRKGLVLTGVCLLLCLPAACKGEPPADTAAPVFSGLHDIEVFAGEGLALRQGVSAVDDRDGEVTFTVDASMVDLDRAGSYTVTYRATDAAGNEAVERITVTVKERSVDEDALWALVDAAIAQSGLATMSVEEQSRTLYFYIKSTLSYVSSSDKGDWKREAWRGLTEHTGDCFTYYAVGRAFFERLGVSVITVTRAPDVLPTTHYWLLVNTGTADAPAWYHWDACPHPKEYPLESILLTDAELLAYNQKVAHYYTFDQALYPSTPES